MADYYTLIARAVAELHRPLEPPASHFMSGRAMH